MRWSLICIPLALLALVAASPSLSLDAQSSTPGQFFVDFEHGTDSASGQSWSTAWRHAPGDPEATGIPARTRLRGGDMVAFAPGVRYRGTIRLANGGERDRPLTFTSGRGGSPAIFDGSDPAESVRPCRSADDCGGSELWPKLFRVEFAAPPGDQAALFSDRGLLFPSQYPSPRDLFDADNLAEFLITDPHDAARGHFQVPKALAEKLARPGESRLVLHVVPNLLDQRQVVSTNGSEVRFDPAGLRFDLSRPEHYAVAGHPSLISKPGQYGWLPGHRAAVVYLPAGATRVSASNGRPGVVLSGASHVAIHGLAFENFSDRGPATPSTAIMKTSAGSDITISGNRFAYFRMPAGNGPLLLDFIDGLTITDNAFSDIVYGSGIRIGKSTNISILRNDISRIGRTGIMLIGTRDATVAYNHISGVHGIHGNGISVYLENHGAKILNNTVVDATQPVTFEGAAGVQNDIEFRNNLLVGAPGADAAALISWGMNSHVSIQGNVLLGGKRGLLLSKSDEDVVVSHNVVNGRIFVSGPGYVPDGYPAQPAWVLNDNRFIDFLPGQRSGRDELSRGAFDAASSAPTGAWSSLCTIVARPEQAHSGASMSVGAGLKCPGF